MSFDSNDFDDVGEDTEFFSKPTTLRSRLIEDVGASLFALTSLSSREYDIIENGTTRQLSVHRRRVTDLIFKAVNAAV